MTTFHVNGTDVMLALHVVRIVGSIVMLAIVGVLIAWAVRPSRRARGRRQDQQDAVDNEDLWRVVDRMEERLEVLERALADQVEQPRRHAPRQDEVFAPADEGRDSGRTI
jgi:membrane protein implicated in regulation of membrane protease activity